MSGARPPRLLGEEPRVLIAALTFLTRIPAPRWLDYEPTRLARSTVYFPLVGVVVGAAGAAVLWIASMLWPPLIAASLAVAATVWLTGAFHEDALADSFDGFGGGWDRAQVLAIMKDSRIGSYGAVALVLALLARVGALAAIGEADVVLAVRALVVAHTLARWSSLPLIWTLPYVSEGGARNGPFAASVTGRRLVVGSLLAMAVTATVLAPHGVGVAVVASGGAVLVTALAARYFRRRLGGMTGDCLGAANQVVELATYLLLAATWADR